VLRPKEKEYAEYVYLATTREASIAYLANTADGGAYPAVRPEIVAGMMFVVPGKPLLQAFSLTANTLLSTIGNNLQRIQTLSTLRDTLLPRLISGRLRLPEAAAEIQKACP
jgi:type I restriction enzyme S subunit